MSKTAKKSAVETDNAYFLKILVYFILGMIWVKINGMPLVPAGLVLGVIIAQHDHFSIDRKVEYAVLLLSAVVAISTGAGAFMGLWF